MEEPVPAGELAGPKDKPELCRFPWEDTGCDLLLLGAVGCGDTECTPEGSIESQAYLQ